MERISKGNGNNARLAGYIAVALAAIVLVMAMGAGIQPARAYAAELAAGGSGVAANSQDSQGNAAGTNVSTAADEFVQLWVDGTFGSAGKAAVLKRINEIRYEACKQHVPNPNNPGKKLALADYVPIKWSHGLEEIAQTRAAEAAVYRSHTRPNGKDFDTVRAEGVPGTLCENLAWNYSGMLEGIEQWYHEKAKWVAQTPGAVTGHYTALINPSCTHVGLGQFTPKTGGWTCTSGEFCYGSTGIDESEIGARGSVRQSIEVLKSSISGLTITGQTKLVGSVTRQYSATIAVLLDSSFSSPRAVQLSSSEPVTWKSSNPAVLEVNSAGRARSKCCGTAVLTASTLGMSANIKVKVTPAALPIKKLIAQKKAIKVTWTKKPALAKGYEIRYSLKKSMKASKTVKVKLGKKTRVIKKLKSGKRYYVQIRSYAKNGGKTYYSAWSKRKSVKVK